MSGSRAYLNALGPRTPELDKGACVGASPFHADLFHGTRREQLLAYQLFCQKCPVTAACAKAKKDAGVMVTRGSLWAGQISARRGTAEPAGPRKRRPAISRLPGRGDGTSKFRGVSWAKKEGVWVSHLRVGNKVHYVGSFPGTPEGEIEAAKAWDEIAQEFRGKNTFLNFPPEDGVPVSKYLGVSWAKRDGRWVARLRLEGSSTKYLGSFPGTPEGEIEAAKLWDRAAVEYRGRRTGLNFPEG